MWAAIKAWLARTREPDPLVMRLVEALDAARVDAERRADALQVTLDRVAENRYDRPARRRQKRQSGPANPLTQEVLSIADDATFAKTVYGGGNPLEMPN